MTDRALSRPWTKEEDDLLKQGVERYGAQDNWIAVAELVPNRTNKACRKVRLRGVASSSNFNNIVLQSSGGYTLCLHL